MKRRVVVTGIGCITPLGNTVEAMWEKLREGVSGVDDITYFDAASFPTQFAAEVSNYRLEDYVDDTKDLQMRDGISVLRSERPPRQLTIPA